MPLDLGTFHPTNAEEFLEGLVAHIVPIVGQGWNSARSEIEPHLRTVATKALATAQQLEGGKISREDADYALRGQELYLANILLFSEFLAYELAQKVLDAVFDVVKAVVKNSTGVNLTF